MTKIVIGIIKPYSLLSFFDKNNCSFITAIKINLSESKTDNDEFVSLIKRYVIDEQIEFDTAKNLIAEYKKVKEKLKND